MVSTKGNYDSDNNIGGWNDISLNAFTPIFTVFSLKRLDFWQCHSSSGSYSKATDSISAALRGYREHYRELPVSVQT